MSQSRREPQSRLDAMADAETLRRLWDSRMLPLVHLIDARPVPEDPSVSTYGWEISQAAREAARAAFRAVPGLRESAP